MKLSFTVPSATGTINDDDPQQSISISDVTLVEGNAGTTAFSFNVTLSNATFEIVTVTANTADGSATLADSDYQQVLNQAAQIDLTTEFAAKSQLINLKGSYALLRTTNGKEYQIPERGSVGFGLVQSEAYIHSDNVTVLPVLAQLENGQLNFDFDKRKFSTSFDLVHGIERFNMRANGSVAPDGRFSVDNQYALPNNMSADGVLSNENGGSAAYIFMGRLTGDRTANGVTYWGAK